MLKKTLVALLALAVAPFATALSLHDPPSPVGDVVRIIWQTQPGDPSVIRIILHNVDSGSDLVLAPAVHTVQGYLVIEFPAGLADNRYILRAISIAHPTTILSETTSFVLSTDGQTSKQRSVDEEQGEDLEWA